MYPKGMIRAQRKADMARYRKTERDRFLTEPEFMRFMLAAAAEDTAFHLFLAAGVFGLRVSEAIALHRDCFKGLSRNMVEIETLKQRGHPSRPVFIDDTTRKVFEEYIEKMKPGQYWLFPSRRLKGKHLSKEYAQILFKKFIHCAGLKPTYSFHSLRHFRGLALWKGSKDLKFVQDQLRHKSMRTSEVYVHMDDRDKAALARTIGPLGKGSHNGQGQG